MVRRKTPFRIFIKPFQRCGRAFFVLLPVFLICGGAWCTGAVHYTFRQTPAATMSFAMALLLLILLAARTTLRCRALAAASLAELAVAVAFLCITPQQQFRGIQWQTPWAKVAEVRQLPDGKFELRNIRDFHYRSEHDYDVRYLTQVIDPERISSIDVALSHWENRQSIAHSMLGFNFDDGVSIVVSLETRLPLSVRQDALAGMYRNFALAMIAGTPRDLYGLRADHRGEALYVYRCKACPETLRRLVRRFFSRAEELSLKPEFYNSLCRNCTTGLLPLMRDDSSGVDDIRVLLNGFSDQLLFQREMLIRREGESFDSLHARCLVPGKCSGADAPDRKYSGTSETGWLQTRNSALIGRKNSQPLRSGGKSKPGELK